MSSENQCVQNMYLRPSGDLLSNDRGANLVLETNLTMSADHECKDQRLGDLLLSLEDIIEMASPSRTHIDMVEIVCMPVSKSVETTYRAMRAS